MQEFLSDDMEHGMLKIRRPQSVGRKALDEHKRLNKDEKKRDKRMKGKAILQCNAIVNIGVLSSCACRAFNCRCGCGGFHVLQV